MIPSSTTCRIFLLTLFTLSIQQAGVTVMSQTKIIYPELKLYRQTLAPEQAAAYQKALETYRNTPPQEKIYSKNDKLNSRYKEISNLAATTPDQINLKAGEFYALSEQAAKKRDSGLEFESLLQAFTLAFWSEFPNYNKAFEMAILLERKLPLVCEEEYPDKRYAYFKLGEAYYLFKDFDKSIELLKEAITETPPRNFTDCANLDARKIIGICYANINQMDTSDYYFQSTLKSTDMVLNRPVYNAIALSHIACNTMLKGEYEKSLALDLEVLPFLKEGDDYGHLAGMYACQCFSYFGLEESSRIAALADSILYYAKKDTYNKNKRLKQAYTILGKYNTNRGNADMAQQYNDSLIKIYQREEELYNSQYIVQARQNMANKEIVAKEAEAATQHRLVIFITSVLILSVLTLTVIFIQYRRLRGTYRILAEKSRRWAEQIPEDYRLDVKKIPVSSTSEEMAVMQQVHTYIIEEKNYLDPELSLDKLSRELSINRSYLSSAINNVMNRNFNDYVNEYRISEAVRIFNSKDYSQYNIDDIYLACGFNSKRSFYYSFKKITGIPPGEYVKSLNSIPSKV